MTELRPIRVDVKTLPITVTTSASTSAALPAVGNYLRVVNGGTSNAFIAVGTSAQTATLPNATPTATSTPVLAGEDVTFTIQYNGTPLQISAIGAGATTLYVQVGEGV